MFVLINLRTFRNVILSAGKHHQAVNICKYQHRHFQTLRQSSLPREVAKDMESTIKTVRKYDPSGYLPGMLLPNVTAKLGYFAVRAFWIETGRMASGHSVGTEAQEDLMIEWWREQIRSIYGDQNASLEHPSLRLLNFYNNQYETKMSMDLLLNILESRALDMKVKQYATVQDIIDHSQHSCGSLMNLVMECAGIIENPLATRAANLIGVCHGMTNALRTSIPIASRTGKIIIPEDLCLKYGVRSPRFLLSALGQGDEKCKEALNKAVRDLSEIARENLYKARLMREQILLHKRGNEAMVVFLPGVASETFLNRLQGKNYDLTDVELRNISFLEKGICTARMITAWITKTY